MGFPHTLTQTYARILGIYHCFNGIRSFGGRNAGKVLEVFASERPRRYFPE